MKNLWHDRRTTLVLVLTVAAIVAPMLLLFGLKNGVATTLRQNSLQDPRNLEVVVYAETSGSFEVVEIMGAFHRS